MPDPFKAYDIRGLYPDQLDENLAYHIGNATAQVLQLEGKRYAVGRDMRVSGPVLKQAFMNGLRDAGVTVVDCGMLSTPALTFSMHHLSTDGGAQITASHNPAEYGGIKITAPGYKPVSAGTGMEEIEAIARAETVFTAEQRGGYEEATTIDAYCESIAPLLDLKRPLKIVVDGGNGIIGTLFQLLSPKMPGITIIPQYFDPDGRFPNHDANPLKPENLPDLQQRVVAEGADFGAAFDGDGDRCALVDENGEIVTCDMATALLAKHYLSKEKGGIAYDLRSSKAVPELITELGGTPIETRVGHSFIKATLKETGAAFAGELSGHYYFRDFYGADSGLYAFILLANVISEAESLSSLIAPICKYHHSGEINFKVASTETVLEKIKALPGAEIAELDGVTARYSDWWCNVRASNTEPVCRLNLEADTAELMQQKVAEISALIEG